MGTPVETITINSLDKKLDSKAGFSSKKKRLYTQVMTHALLEEGMTYQNQVRFCNAFVATGISPIVKLLNTDAGNDWKSIILPLVQQPYFVNVVRMRLRFFMQLLSKSIRGAFKNSQDIFNYSVKNIVDMEFDTRKKFRIDNVDSFRNYILNPWKAESAITAVDDTNTIKEFMIFVERCLKADKKENLKNHPNFDAFVSWIEGIAKNNQNSHHSQDNITEKATNELESKENLANDGEAVQPVVPVKTIDEIRYDEESPENNEASQKKAVLSLQNVIDLFEKRIVERDTEIKNLRMQVISLNKQIRREKQAARDMQSKLTNELATEKQNHETTVKKLNDEIKDCVETLNQQEQYISEQKSQLQERKELLKDNDVRFDNYYKQHMLALGNKLKLSFSDLRDSINDLQGDEKEFIETAFLDIVECLKKEGINV